MIEPRISVLMPVYNGRDFLRPAVESILAQKFEDFELIIVDDGSTDDSREIIRGYRDPRIRLFAADHAGLTASLNRGGKACRGPFIARMDADDIAAPDRFEAQYGYLTEHANIGLVCTDATLIDAEGQAIGAHRMGAWNDELLRDTLVFRARTPPVIHPSVMMRREVFERLEGYRDYSCAEDRDFWLRAMDHYRFGLIARPLLHYRVHARGISRSRRSTQAKYGLMATVVHLVRAKACVDIFADRCRLFERYLEEARTALEREYLPAEAAFNATRDHLKAGRYLVGAFQGSLAVARFGARPLPWRRVACLRRLADELTARIVAELHAASAAGETSVGQGTT